MSQVSSCGLMFCQDGHVGMMGHIGAKTVMLGPFRSCPVMSVHIRSSQVTLGQNRSGQAFKVNTRSSQCQGLVSQVMSGQTGIRWVN